jgi:four helix bundle protein
MQKDLIDANPLLRLSIDFSRNIITYCESLEEKRKYVVAQQLLKSGTTIGANAMGAQNPESKADFIHKIKIAANEADETQYRLMLCDLSKNYPPCEDLLAKLNELNKIIGKILGTARRKFATGSFSTTS